MTNFFKILTPMRDGEGTLSLKSPVPCERTKWKCPTKAAEYLEKHYGQGLVVDQSGVAILSVVKP